MRHSSYAVRTVAGLTMAYSVAITVWPKLLAKPCHMLDEQGEVPVQVQTLIRSVGSRDAAVAAALLFAPPGPATRVLTTARIVSDLADSVWFARLPLTTESKAKVSGTAAGWAALEAGAHWLDERARRRG